MTKEMIQTYDWLQGRIDRFSRLAREAYRRKDMADAMAYREKVISCMETQLFLLEMEQLDEDTH